MFAIYYHKNTTTKTFGQLKLKILFDLLLTSFAQATKAEAVDDSLKQEKNIVLVSGCSMR